jgi:hypothetical protein
MPNAAGKLRTSDRATCYRCGTETRIYYHHEGYCPACDECQDCGSVSDGARVHNPGCPRLARTETLTRTEETHARH